VLSIRCVAPAALQSAFQEQAGIPKPPIHVDHHWLLTQVKVDKVEYRRPDPPREAQTHDAGAGAAARTEVPAGW
jgi:hypothetical protein